ncbi:MAG TPA: DNA translocase FtsK 4TM domain-containing protein, partial [Jatrophihabitans sp.]|nr:DNA translocase FtsK 4TM domain-containing protein [Jatrophihabitans sp.]
MFGQLLARIWSALGLVVGTLARAIGRNAATARELDPAHRRDGAGLAVLGAGLISAAAVWFAAAGALGRLITGLLRVLLGNAAVTVPVLLVCWAVHLLRQQPQPERRGRLLVGCTAIGLTVTGMLHLWAGSPTNWTGRRHAGGLVGMPAGELERVLPASLVVLVLFLLGAFGALVVTATPLNQLPELVRELFVRQPADPDALPDDSPSRWRRRWAEPELTDDADQLGPDEPFLDDPFPAEAGLAASAQAVTETLPGPARRPRRPKPAEPELPPISRPTQLELNGGAGLYTLPPADLLGAGTQHLAHTRANDEVIASLSQV